MGSKHRRCGLGSNRTDWARRWTAHLLDANGSLLTIPLFGQTLPGLPLTCRIHPSLPHEPGSQAGLTQALCHLHQLHSLSPQHNRPQGLEERKAVQPCWARCCCNTCAQDQFRLAGRALKKRALFNSILQSKGNRAPSTTPFLPPPASPTP